MNIKQLIIKWNISSIIFSFLSLFFLYKGYDKIANYQNSEYTFDKINVYVGGDAYNYIINANYATGFFVLALLCAVIALGIIVISEQKKVNLNLQVLNLTIKNSGSVKIDNERLNNE
jgi:hypothetical protein